MRFNMWHTVIPSVLALSLVMPVEAAPPAKTSSAKTSAPAGSGLATALHQAKTLLDTAIHDYDGHRAKAVGEIHHAIHELSPHHHKANHANQAKPANETTTPGETQAQSDMQLKQALQILSNLQGQVPKNHAKAAGHIEKAIEELNTALKIK